MFWFARALTALGCSLMLCTAASGQSATPDSQPAAPTAASAIPALSGESLGGLLIPVAPRTGDCMLSSLRTWQWRHADTQRLLLEGDVLLDLAGWTFETERALVWINRVDTADGMVTQVAVYMPATRPGTQASTSHARGENLLVVATLRGRTLLDTALLHRKPPPPDSPVLRTGEARLAAWVASVVSNPEQLTAHPMNVPPGTAPTAEGDLPVRGVLGRSRGASWLRRTGGMLAFSADAVELAGGETDATVVADGAVALEYRPAPGDTLGRLRLTAERAVIFVTPGTIESLADSDLRVEDIRGVYLEGGVTAIAERDDYEVRAPRMYYDFQQDRAVMVDAVLRTYDRRRGTPVVARADELRQLAAHQWSMKNVVLSASSFAVPTLAVASQEAMLTRTPATVLDDGSVQPAGVLVDATNNTLEAGGTPIFHWPRFKGTVQDVPLERIKSGWDQYTGALVETTWDVYSLLGMTTPSGEELLLEVDGYTSRGVGAGISWSQQSVDSSSHLKLYGLLDSGTQRTDAGVKQDVPTDHRYEAIWNNTTMLSPEWMLQTQVSKFSDSTFVSAWREDEFRNRREYETSAFLKWQDNAASFSLLADYSLNNFVSNSWLLASQGFSLDEMPRASLRLFGLDIGETLTWTNEWHFSRFRANIPRGTPLDNGVFGDAFLNGADQPIGDNDSIADNLAATENIHDEWAMRVVSQHHLAMPMSFGPVQVTPFAVALWQGWMTKPQDVDPDQGDMRSVGGAGVSVSTTVQRVWNDVEDRVLDLHRLRAIVEPSVTAFYAGASFDPDDPAQNPQYDPWIDATSTGASLRMAVSSTLQTMRGGPGQWFDVDWLQVDLGAVLVHDASARHYATPQWFQQNPLYAQLGNFADTRVRWQVGEGVAAIGEGIWDFDERTLSRAAAGVQLTHSPRFSTSAEFRFIDVTPAFVAANPEALVRAGRAELLAFNARWEVGKLYDVQLRPVWNFSESDWQTLGAVVRRSFPDFDLDFYVNYDSIRDETRAGVVLGRTNF